MTRRSSIIAATLCTLGLLAVALLLTGTLGGSAYAQTAMQAAASQAGQPDFASPASPTTLNNSLIFLAVSFVAILLTAFVSIFTWGRARS